MAGLSQRFINAGFSLPKYMLYVGNKSVFSLSLMSFANYFSNCRFLFIIRDVFDTEKFIENECEILGIKEFEIVTLNRPTQGQAETVFLGLNDSKIVNKTEPLTIFNIDTFRHDFVFPEKLIEWDGYLEVFWGEGSNWSYAKTESSSSTRVVQTTEKVQISNFCSTGLYYFKSASSFEYAYEKRNVIVKTDNINELYIAPLYNILINEGKNIHINLIKREEVQFCGIPSEYIEYITQTILKK